MKKNRTCTEKENVSSSHILSFLKLLIGGLFIVFLIGQSSISYAQTYQVHMKILEIDDQNRHGFVPNTNCRFTVQNAIFGNDYICNDPRVCAERFVMAFDPPDANRIITTTLASSNTFSNQFGTTIKPFDNAYSNTLKIDNTFYYEIMANYANLGFKNIQDVTFGNRSATYPVSNNNSGLIWSSSVLPDNITVLKLYSNSLCSGASNTQNCNSASGDLLRDNITSVGGIFHSKSYFDFINFNTLHPGAFTPIRTYTYLGCDIKMAIKHTPYQAEPPLRSGLGSICAGAMVTLTTTDFYPGKNKNYVFERCSSDGNIVYESKTWSSTTGVPSASFSTSGLSGDVYFRVKIAGIANINDTSPTEGPYSTLSNVYVYDAPPIVTASPISPVCKGGNNAGIQFSVSGTTNNYSLSIQRDNGGSWINWDFRNSSTTTSLANGSTTIRGSDMFYGLNAGTYKYQVKNYTDFGNQCMTISTLTISDPTDITFTASTPQNTLTCYGGTNGTISLGSASGGNGGTYTVTVLGATNGSLSAGNYTIKVKDRLGCVSLGSQTVQLNQPTQLTSTFSVSSYNGFGVSCLGINNGTIAISPNGAPMPNDVGISQYTSGLEKYVYNSSILGLSWQKVSNYESGCGGKKDFYIAYDYNGASYFNYYYTTIDCSKYSLSPGTYRVKVSDFNNCATITSPNLVINEPPLYLTTGIRLSNFNGYNSSCSNSNNATITLTVSGGVGKKSVIARHYVNQPYWGDCADECYGRNEECCFLLDNYVVDQVITSTTLGNVLSLTNLEPKIYEIQVVDANGCVSYLNTVTVTSPPAILAFAKVTPITCFNANNGIVTLTASGGSGGFNYSLSTNTLTGAVPNSASNLFDRKPPGIYKARIRDANGCEYNNPTGILLTFTQPGMLTVLGASFNIPCKDGTLSSIAGIVRGGTPPYKYTWTQGFSTTNLGQSFVPNAKAGTYVANVTDKNNCTDNNSLPFQMTLTASEPASKLSFISSFLPVDCYGNSSGKVFLQASGGWGVFKYGSTKSVINFPILSSETISGLAIGLKKYFIRDDKGCLDSTLVNITEPDSLKIGISTLTNISCFNSKDGVAILSAIGGNTRYTYKLTPASLTAQNFNSSTISGLDAILYTTSVTDENNCPANSVSFTLTQPSALISTGKSTDASCGLPTGTATITASGGVLPYAYQWLKNGTVTGFSSSSISGIYSGFYTAIAIDGNNCKTPTVIAVNDLSGPTVTGTALSGTRCWYDRTGSATATAIAFGTKSITGISWVGTSNLGSYTAGLKGDTVYYVGSTDTEGCFSSDTVYIPGPAKGQSTFSKLDPLCNNASTGKINILNVGGTPPYTNYLYTSSFGKSILDSLIYTQNSPSSINFQNLIGYNSTNPLRNYRFWFVDSKGCASEPLFTTLYNPSAFNVNFGSDSTEVCLGTTIQLDAGNPGKTYRWLSNTGTFNSTSRNVSINQPGKYTVIVSDANACTASGTFLFKATNGYPGARFLIAPEVYVGDTILLAEISWPYPDTVAWSWPNGIAKIDSTIGNLSVKATRPGTYSITMRAQQGICKAIQTKTIRAIAKPGREMESIYLGLKEVRLYPNPSEGQFTLTAEFGTIADIQIEILDAVHEKSLFSYSDQGQSLYEKTIDLKEYPAGLYFVRISTGENVKVVRWVKL